MAQDSLIVEHLRHIRDKVDRNAEDMRDVKTRFGILEEQMAGQSKQYASLSVRLDRIDARLERVENRLDLLPAQ